jgi:hypothetical protein
MRIVSGAFALSTLAGLAMIVGCGSEGGTAPSTDGLGNVETQSGGNPDVAPSGRGGGTSFEHAGSGGSGSTGGTTSSGIFYHGGPLMTAATTNVYYIWYGSWDGNSAVPILTDLASTIGGSPYYNINTSYTDGAGKRPSNSVSYAGSTTDAYSQGKSLTDTQVANVVKSAIANGLPSDTNAVYFVLTSADVTASSGFCSTYCGWHRNYARTTAQGGGNIKYAFVGNPDRCPTACEAPEIRATSPNGNPGADGMASIVSHELVEAVTDPLGNAWYDRKGYENADKCAWTFGTEYAASNGGKANVHLGVPADADAGTPGNERDYLIQRNWVNAGGGSCALSYAK